MSADSIPRPDDAPLSRPGIFNTKGGLPKLGLILLLLASCLTLLSCDWFKKKPTQPAQLMTLSDWRADAPQVEAFALQLYDDAGKPLDLQWVDDPGLVKRFVEAIPAGQATSRRTTNDLTQATFVRLKDGTTFRFDLVDIAKGQPGLASFLGGTIPTPPDLQGVIAQAYRRSDYNSAGEKGKEKEAPREPGAQPFTEEALIPEPTKPCEIMTEVTLVLYQDDPGDDSGKKYAEAKSANPNTENAEAKGLNSIINKLRQLRGQCKCVKTLLLVSHGNSGTFRIGPKNTPVQSGTRVGLRPGQTSPASFGQGIKPYLCRNATIKLFTCRTAKNGGTPETNGPKAIQELADASGANVQASDEDVVQQGNDLTTEGNVLTATPGGSTPTITTPAPAGGLH